MSLKGEAIPALSEVARAEWDALANPHPDRFDPFVSWDFLEALEAAGCVAPETGWAPQHLLLRERGRLAAAMPLYLKGHSYGEYIFDHAWADALHRAGGRYYPKLLSAVPFTPVTGPRLLAPTEAGREALVSAALQLAKELRVSSLHLNFQTPGQIEEAASAGLQRRAGVQFHWANPGYRDFDDFLSTLSSGKRRSIRKERARAAEGLDIRRVQGRDLSERDWDVFFACYMDTGARKWGSPYLNREFFSLLGERMGERVILFIAERRGRPIAAALNFLGGDCLYGRYWGRLDDQPFLHFELCYYQAIELAIGLGLPRVEAGAQGEHKLARGYAPVTTWSAHWIAHPGLSRAVADFLAMERPAVADEVEALEAHTPFKKG